MNVPSPTHIHLVTAFFLSVAGVLPAAGDEHRGGWEIGVKADVSVKFRGELAGFSQTDVRVDRGDEEIEIPLEKLVSIRRLPADGSALDAKSGNKPAKKATPAQGEGFRIELKSGGGFKGRLAGFTKDRVRFESDSFGDLEIPARAIATILRQGNRIAASKTSGWDETYRVALENGEIIHGDLTPDGDPKWFRVKGDNVSARFPTYLIGRIDFPKEEKGEPSAADPEKSFEITVSGGNHFVCSTPALDNGFLTVATIDGIRLRIALGKVESILPHKDTSLPRHGGILVWSGFAAKEGAVRDSWNRVLELTGRPKTELAEALPPQEAFANRLLENRVLFIPPMPLLKLVNYEEEVELLGKKVKRRVYFQRVMKPAIEDFLRRGGHVVCVGIDGNHAEFLKEVGIGAIKLRGNRDGQNWTISPEVLKGFSEEFKEVNFPANSFLYEAADWKIATGTAKQSPLIWRGFGKGRSTIFGANFNSTNGEIERLLAAFLNIRTGW